MAEQWPSHPPGGRRKAPVRLRPSRRGVQLGADGRCQESLLGRPFNAGVPDVEPLPGATSEVLSQITDRATVLVAADLVGIAREAVSRTVAYDREREQFGVPVGSFQAIKHAMADLHVGVTMAEHAALYAAHVVEVGADEAALAVAVAKGKASEVALQATAAMIQYHGGIGYTWEHEAHFFYKRAKRLAGQFGDVDAQRERIAALTV